jgi:hypothetical protein
MQFFCQEDEGGREAGKGMFWSLGWGNEGIIFSSWRYKMTLRGPDADDRKKIHAEVSQIVNQRLSLTILTVTIFGAMIAWLTPKNTPTPNSEVGTFTFIGSLLLVLVLFILFLLTYHISYMLRLFTTYLIVTDASNWEKDWATYRSKFSYIGYTKPQSIIFIILGAAAAGYPFLLSFAYSLCIEPCWGAILCIVAGIVHCVFVFGMGLKGWFAKESEFKRKWETLKQDQP